jgi:uncharacterized membrane protein
MALLLLRSAALAGAALSGYALYVEHRMASGPYHAACDIQEGPLAGASCTAVFGSDAGHILSYFGLVKKGGALDLSNATLGLVYYLAVLLHGGILKAVAPGVPPAAGLLAVATGGVAFSLLLAYILVVRLHDFCVVCTAMYAANAAIWLAALMLWWSGGAAGVADAAAAAAAAVVSGTQLKSEAKML